MNQFEQLFWNYGYQMGIGWLVILFGLMFDLAFITFAGVVIIVFLNYTEQKLKEYYERSQRR